MPVHQNAFPIFHCRMPITVLNIPFQNCFSQNGSQKVDKNMGRLGIEK